jgi:hypothetical protein
MEKWKIVSVRFFSNNELTPFPHFHCSLLAPIAGASGIEQDRIASV